MSRIITRKSLSEQLYQMEIKSSGAFACPQPGQYVILRLKSGGPGITMPVVKTDASRETLTLIADSIPERLSALRNPCVSGTDVELEGPFGQAFHIGYFGSVMCVTDRDGAIALYPLLTALRQAKNHLSTIFNSLPGNDQTIENEIRNVSDNYAATGSMGGRETIHLLGQALVGRKVDQVFVTGSAKTIRDTFAVCTECRTPVQAMLCLTEKNQNGQHGIFRLSICGNNRSLCVDGHNFNAYYPGFDELIRRFADGSKKSVGEKKGIQV